MLRKMLTVVAAVIATLQVAGPAAAAEVLTISGSETGANFEAFTCPGDMVLIGVASKTGWYVDGVAPLCSDTDANGAWSYDTHQQVLGDLIGSSGPLTQHACNRGDAVVGMSGRAGRWIDQLTLRCRKLVSPTLVSSTSSIYTVNAGGGTGGTALAARTCASRRPVIRVTGRFTSYVNTLSMVCLEV